MRSAVVAKTIAGFGKTKNAPRKKHADEPDDDDDSSHVDGGEEEEDEEEGDEEREAVETQEEDGAVSSKAATFKASVDTSVPTKKPAAVAKTPTAVTKNLVGGKTPEAEEKPTAVKKSTAASSNVPAKAPAKEPRK
ncbi:hypothetical protein PR003_g25511 [Phytophthora rubi]|uniref:Uncharacterized protein n=1 Tax=Phytophthora rubi TaxID=129364 RepID=A0A6A3GDI3_9STRA|nr:hypothetical protein PR001_g32410 [Phytophthora rubi]KAE8962207.1 hypothetical protein PR002_g29672 [Phytophthora rubi]KAE9289609.1 hypothetical protein PR003_g25511 [Phytophthora rubi]